MKCKDCKYYIRNPIFKFYYFGWCDNPESKKYKKRYFNGDIQTCEKFEETDF